MCVRLGRPGRPRRPGRLLLGEEWLGWRRTSYPALKGQCVLQNRNAKGEEMRMKRLQIPLTVAVVVLLAVGAYFVPTVPRATMGPVTGAIGVVKVAKWQSVAISYWLFVAGPDR